MASETDGVRNKPAPDKVDGHPHDPDADEGKVDSKIFDGENASVEGGGAGAGATDAGE